MELLVVAVVDQGPTAAFAGDDATLGNQLVNAAAAEVMMLSEPGNTTGGRGGRCRNEGGRRTGEDVDKGKGRRIG